MDREPFSSTFSGKAVYSHGKKSTQWCEPLKFNWFFYYFYKGPFKNGGHILFFSQLQPYKGIGGVGFYTPLKLGMATTLSMPPTKYKRLQKVMASFLFSISFFLSFLSFFKASPTGRHGPDGLPPLLEDEAWQRGPGPGKHVYKNQDPLLRARGAPWLTRLC